jgi:subtilase family serine protease
MELNVTLPVQNRAAMLAQLKDIYTPSSPNFHKYISPAQFAAKYNPTQAQYTAAVNYFKSQGFTVNGGQWLTRNILINGTIAKIQSTFGVKMNNYKDTKTGISFFANDRQPTTTLSFPLWSVTGLDNYSNPQPLLSENPLLKGGKAKSVKSQVNTGSGPYGSFLGSDMYYAYGGDLYDWDYTGSGQGIGIWEYYGTNLQDLANYYDAAGGTYSQQVYLESTDWSPVACVYTKLDNFCDDTEQNLDLTQALGMAADAQAIMYIGTLDSAIFAGIVNDVNNNWYTYGYAYPSVISISWYWFPTDVTANDDTLIGLAMNGVTVLAASGDYGSYFYGYPAEDPYVTAVGGTQLFTDPSDGDWVSEITWVDSGGGIAYDYLTIPTWQQTSGVINNSNGGSTSYRNGPDVAADAYWNYFTCADLQPCLANAYGGTSFASPLWAGYVADYNQAAIYYNSPTLGWFTPATYLQNQSWINASNYSDYAYYWHDITSGPSNGSYNAVTGYDLVTGWGSPNYYADQFFYYDVIDGLDDCFPSWAGCGT